MVWTQFYSKSASEKLGVRSDAAPTSDWPGLFIGIELTPPALRLRDRFERRLRLCVHVTPRSWTRASTRRRAPENLREPRGHVGPRIHEDTTPRRRSSAVMKTGDVAMAPTRPATPPGGSPAANAAAEAPGIRDRGAEAYGQAGERERDVFEQTKAQLRHAIPHPVPRRIGPRHSGIARRRAERCEFDRSSTLSARATL